MFTQQKRKKEVLVLALLLSVLIVWGAKSAAARHVLLTIGCTVSGPLRSTYPLKQIHEDALSQGRRRVVFRENTKDKRKIEEALSQLEDGDILVLSVHANSETFGWGRRGLRWEDFWDSFLGRGTRRPRLSLVVISGCVETVDLRTKQRTGATDPELDRIREHLNAEAIIALRGEEHAMAGSVSVRNFLQLVADKDQKKRISQFAGVDEESSDGEVWGWASHWRFLTAPVVDRDNATIAKLRETARRRAASLVAEKDTEFQVEAMPVLPVREEPITPALFSDQETLVKDLGYPDSFTILMNWDQTMKPPRFVRYEVWNYYGLNASFVFDNGVFGLDADLPDIPSNAVFSDLRPTQFHQDLTFQELNRIIGAEPDISAEVLPGLMENTTVYDYNNQVIAGFQAGKLIYIQTIPIFPR